MKSKKMKVNVLNLKKRDDNRINQRSDSPDLSIISNSQILKRQRDQRYKIKMRIKDPVLFKWKNCLSVMKSRMKSKKMKDQRSESPDLSIPLEDDSSTTEDSNIIVRTPILNECSINNSLFSSIPDIPPDIPPDILDTAQLFDFLEDDFLDANSDILDTSTTEDSNSIARIPILNQCSIKNSPFFNIPDILDTAKQLVYGLLKSFELPLEMCRKIENMNFLDLNQEIIDEEFVSSDWEVVKYSVNLTAKSGGKFKVSKNQASVIKQGLELKSVQDIEGHFLNIVKQLPRFLIDKKVTFFCGVEVINDRRCFSIKKFFDSKKFIGISIYPKNNNNSLYFQEIFILTQAVQILHKYS